MYMRSTTKLIGVLLPHIPDSFIICSSSVSDVTGINPEPLLYHLSLSVWLPTATRDEALPVADVAGTLRREQPADLHSLEDTVLTCEDIEPDI